MKKRKDYPKVTVRPDLAWTFGYDGSGNYVGKPWGSCW
jgi:hypothetical protein